MIHTPETACSLDVMRTFRSCSHLLHHRKCPPLQGKGRLDLSLEALVVDKRFTGLFTDEAANEALMRLLEAGYRFR